MSGKKEQGLTLIELMMVIVILAILMVTVIIMAFGNIIDKSQEASTKGCLGALRDAINNFYADEGMWPKRLDGPIFVGKYIDKIPEARLKRGIIGSRSNRVTYETAPQPPYGGWLYNSDMGYITINHIERDTKGVYYSTY